LFGDSAARALATPGTANDRLRALITGHIEVVLANQDVVRTFLNEARMLDDEHRARVLSARDNYEQAFRDVIRQGIGDGSFRADVDPKITSIFLLSVLNAVQRWYQPEGDLSPVQLAEAVFQFTVGSLI
ncbi:MAG TPA: TetR/AcrR family transcriptional regulator C-terminal domain-containing protein, partial [Acidimicrobiia bacterium]|nr:TetR/AcrR family transcriptional regulator C-terminal domain-containing protein [Acidimicrobiia bacterium]